MNCLKVILNIQEELRRYIKENAIKSLVIGVSGGIDSALCCAIAHPVCRDLGIPLIGRSLPIESKSDEITRAHLIGEVFCDLFDVKDLANPVRSMLDATFHNGWENGTIRQANIKARMRMIYLYDLAQLHNGMVLSTDNLTELLLGFWTLHGDVGDYGMLQNLWKTEVYELAKYKVTQFKVTAGQKQHADALQACIDAVPTDGLGVSDSDFDQLGADSYEEIDKILQGYFNELAKDENSDNVRSIEKHPVIQRHLRTEFKRNNPYNIPRTEVFRGITNTNYLPLR